MRDELHVSDRSGMVAQHRRSTPAGFTLIELLVAITVLATVAVLGWRGLDAIVRARVAITEDTEQTRGMQLTFAQLESDCAHIAPSSLVANRTTLLAADERLVLIRTVFSDGEPTRVQTVAYRLVNGQLRRQESLPTRDLKVLDASWRDAIAEASDADGVVMQSGVAAMSTRTWQSDGQAWRAAGAQTQAARPTAGAPVIVEGLEVALELQQRPGKLVKIFLLGAA